MTPETPRVAADEVLGQVPSSEPAVSVVISTFNRAPLLHAAVAQLVAQRTAVPYEVILVDNNSTDETSSVIDELVRRHAGVVRGGFERRQGPSNGRNRGIALSRAPLVAFTDDDVVVTPDWLQSIVEAMAAHPDVDCVGGRVLPIWMKPPPAWMTRRHWPPLALVDYGDTPFYVDSSRRLCLLTANVAYRRAALDEIGWFSRDFRRCQDHELLLRLWQAGRRGLYLPSLVTTCEVPGERLAWSYHRRWHTEHGAFRARMWDREPSGRSRLPTLFGVSAVFYRQCASSAVRWAVSAATGRRDTARHAEASARHTAAFIATRTRMWWSGQAPTRGRAPALAPRPRADQPQPGAASQC